MSSGPLAAVNVLFVLTILLVWETCRASVSSMQLRVRFCSVLSWPVLSCPVTEYEILLVP